MLKKYEVMFILDQDTQDIKSLSTKMIDILKKDGKVIEQNDLGLIDFAYEINHKKKGHYFVVIVEATAEAIKEFERITNIEKNVIRKLVIGIESEQNYEQSVVLSKTDMTQYEEELRPRRDFRKPFVRRNENEGSADSKNFRKPFVKKDEPELTEELINSFVSKIKEKYKSTLEKSNSSTSNQEASKDGAKLTSFERAEFDGSRNIEESRYELLRYSFKLRDIATEKSVSKKLQHTNVKDLTKKELVEYLQELTNLTFNK